MKCPNCDKKMKDKSFWYYGISDWDMDYPGTFHEEYRCAACDIKYINDEWIIPNKYQRATEKQIKCAEFICRELGMSYDPILKTKTWKFINTYFDEAKLSREANFQRWCEDNAHWLPEEEF